MLDYEFLYIISIPIYIFFLVITIYKKTDVKKILLWTLFYFYLISLLTVTIFPIPIQGLKEMRQYGEGMKNFIPFHSIWNIVLNNNLSFFIKTKQIIGNIILFIPMGFFIPFIWEKINQLKKALAIGLLCSFSIELSQYLISLLLGFNYKVTDVDDIFLNIFGFAIGFFFNKLSYGRDLLSKRS